MFQNITILFLFFAFRRQEGPENASSDRKWLAAEYSMHQSPSE